MIGEGLTCSCHSRVRRGVLCGPTTKREGHEGSATSNGGSTTYRAGRVIYHTACAGGLSFGFETAGGARIGCLGRTLRWPRHPDFEFQGAKMQGISITCTRMSFRLAPAVGRSRWFRVWLCWADPPGAHHEEASSVLGPSRLQSGVCDVRRYDELSSTSQPATRLTLSARRRRSALILPEQTTHKANQTT
jgi:hypothetical protein